MPSQAAYAEKSFLASAMSRSPLAGEIEKARGLSLDDIVMLML